MHSAMVFVSTGTYTFCSHASGGKAVSGAFPSAGPAMRQCAAGAGLVSAEEAASIALDPDRDSQAGEREARQRIGQAMEVPGAPKGSLILDFFAEILYT